MNSNYNFITIDGNTGAGKTSLATAFSREFGGNLILERFVDNPFLPLAFHDPSFYGFRNEVYFLIERYEQLTETLQTIDLKQDLHFCDYLFIKTLLYAKVNLPKREYDLFERVFNNLFLNFPIPDLTIYIHATTERLVKNIAKRARDFEQGVDPNYLQAVEDVYFEHFQREKHQRILICHVDKMDFVDNEAHYCQIKALLSKDYDLGIHHIKFDK